MLNLEQMQFCFIIQLKIHFAWWICMIIISFIKYHHFTGIYEQPFQKIKKDSITVSMQIQSVHVVNAAWKRSGHHNQPARATAEDLTSRREIRMIRLELKMIPSSLTLPGTRYKSDMAIIVHPCHPEIFYFIQTRKMKMNRKLYHFNFKSSITGEVIE